MPNDKSLKKALQVIKIFNTLFLGHAINPEEITPSFWSYTDLQITLIEGILLTEWHHLVAHSYVTLSICVLFFKDFLIQQFGSIPSTTDYTT